MKQRASLIRRITEEVGKSSQPLPGIPIVELAGDRRVLIENHRGVTEYSSETICVAVSFGHILVKGSCLEICRMTAHQMVICGSVERISLERRGRC